MSCYTLNIKNRIDTATMITKDDDGNINETNNDYTQNDDIEKLQQRVLEGRVYLLGAKSGTLVSGFCVHPWRVA